MPTIVSPADEINDCLAGVWRIISFVDHPLEYRFYAPIPPVLYALDGHGIKLRRRSYKGRTVSQKVVINNPYENLPLVKQVHYLAVRTARCSPASRSQPNCSRITRCRSNARSRARTTSSTFAAVAASAHTKTPPT
jgi:hypothetical protein